MQKLDVSLHELYGASTIEESMDSANPSLSPDDCEIVDPVKKFLARLALSKVDAVLDENWDTPIAAEIQKRAALEDQPCDDFEVVRNEIRVQQDGLTMQVALNKAGQIVTAAFVKI
jgi:hypothetical protein